MSEEMNSADTELELDLKKLQEERDSLFERLARVTADFKNGQKRLEDDKRQAIEYANGSLVTSLLPIIDNLERALAVDPTKADVATILKGMELIHEQWLAVLKAQHVEQIDPEVGEVFNQAMYQSLLRQPSEKYKNTPEPVVVAVLQKGYAMRGRVLRPAQVAVNASEG